MSILQGVGWWILGVMCFIFGPYAIYFAFYLSRLYPADPSVTVNIEFYGIRMWIGLLGLVLVYMGARLIKRGFLRMRS